MELWQSTTGFSSTAQMVTTTPCSAVRQTDGFLLKRVKIRTAKRELYSNKPPQKMAAQEQWLAAEHRKEAKGSEVFFHETRPETAEVTFPAVCQADTD